MDFLMECLGEERDYDYWFFSGVTGDSFMQIFSRKPDKMALSFTHNQSGIAIRRAFDACGYHYDYIQNAARCSYRDALDRRVRETIDRGIPVIARVNDAFHSFAVICGYDEHDLYYISGEDLSPKPCRYEELIFVTDPKPKPALAQAYRDAVMDIPRLMAMPDSLESSFGKMALVDWAQSIQNGAF